MVSVLPSHPYLASSDYFLASYALAIGDPLTPIKETVTIMLTANYFRDITKIAMSAFEIGLSSNAESPKPKEPSRTLLQPLNFGELSVCIEICIKLKL